VTPAGGRYAVDSARRAHILYGDLTGGGHKHGVGKGRSEFPASWSDDDIIHAVESVANDPGSTRVQSGKRYVRVIGVRNSVSVTAVIDPQSGSIVTGYPT